MSLAAADDRPLERTPYEPPTDPDTPLDAIQLALVKALIPVLVRLLDEEDAAARDRVSAEREAS